ncbi:endonuclease/exonuclease/phosphatase family protein [Litchfieldia salsa]|uniref:Metal-dependent hydrolase, endonuclease/exonuclease/phosphatase family n=1 Tax=Litchfieldia salsa TaxID=930152 RepID=A0A1H0T7D0_9BACI|nr:endonuclease/exonuclease/phosphatase family protein [Litchfieldia salsa]SDP49952.1 Metal-dependent hydrolase, endonuclease/exonuclease/phosphatase family [Litchfieldia salsa]
MNKNKQNIKVMTFNIHHGKGTDKRVDLKRISEVIAKSNADIIGLNEVDRHFSARSQFLDQIKILASEINFYYVFCPSITKYRKKKKMVSQYGNALLSRFPISTYKTYSFNLKSKFTEGRSILDVTLDVKGKMLSCFVSHLSLHPVLHKKQSQFIFNQANEPAIILGDWNMKYRSSKWRRITQRYTDVWDMKGKGNGNTFPSTNPRTRLDYIFVSKSIKIHEIMVFDDIPLASDHLPVVATITI